MKYLPILFTFLASSLLSQNDTLTFAEATEHFREEYKKEHLENERSPIKAADLADLRFFAPAAKYRVECTFERTPDEKPFDLPTYSGATQQYRKYGVLHFELDGQPLQLSVYQNMRLQRVPGYKDYLFLPFRDATSGDATYGGGRYIDLKLAEVEAAAIVLDFNRAYNPWCCYSDGYSCPVPPVENTLPVGIEAGEMMFAGAHKTK